MNRWTREHSLNLLSAVVIVTALLGLRHVLAGALASVTPAAAVPTAERVRQQRRLERAMMELGAAPEQPHAAWAPRR